MDQKLNHSVEKIIHSPIFEKKKEFLEQITSNGTHKALEKKIEASKLQNAFEQGDYHQIQKEMAGILNTDEGKKLLKQLSSIFQEGPNE